MRKSLKIVLFIPPALIILYLLFYMYAWRKAESALSSVLASGKMGILKDELKRNLAKNPLYTLSCEGKKVKLSGLNCVLGEDSYTCEIKKGQEVFILGAQVPLCLFVRENRLFEQPHMDCLKGIRRLLQTDIEEFSFWNPNESGRILWRGTILNFLLASGELEPYYYLRKSRVDIISRENSKSWYATVLTEQGWTFNFIGGMKTRKELLHFLDALRIQNCKALYTEAELIKYTKESDATRKKSLLETLTLE